jgi:hypothetical protein
MSLALLARRESIVQVKALIAANALEVLRYHFGHRVLVPTGRAVARDDDLLWPPGSAKANARMSFGEILDAFAGDHGLPHWESARFKSLRNAVVHTGEVPRANLLEKYKEAIDAVHFVDTAVLALLDWDKVGGKYLPCNQPQNYMKIFSR